MDPKKISDNKTFWKTVKPLFSEKYHATESIILVERNQIIDKDDCIAETFNDFFSNAVKNLGIVNSISHDTNSDPIINAVNKYTNHPSIRKIIADEQNDSSSFEFTSVQKVYKEINLLNPSKAFPKDAIPPLFIKDSSELFAVKIENNFNVCVESCVFSTNQKHADVTVYKKGDRNDKANYRPVSILPPMSKMFEKLLLYQINDYMDPKLSKFLCGFRKGFSAQHCLIMLLEKWKRSVDSREFY